MKTSELVGPALDWAVAKCEGSDYSGPTSKYLGEPYFKYSTDWAQGGSIIEREEISVRTTFYAERWKAEQDEGPTQYGPTPLIAAMRCYVASKLGDEVEIPA